MNLAIHAVNALLAFALLSRSRPGEAGAGRLAPGVATLVFALHPVQTEAVTYASGRSTSLAAVLVLASLLAWVVGRERRSAALHALLSPALFLLALAVRETAVVLPVALLLWHVTTGPHGGLAAALRATAEHWIALALGVAALLAIPAYGPFFASSLGARGLVAQLLTQVNAVGWLVGQLLRPDRLNADPMLPEIAVPTPSLALLAVALAGSVALALRGLRARPALAFGTLWFFLWLAPTNSLLPRLDVANDRQLYLALLGPAWLAGIAADRIAARSRTLALGLVAALALALAGATAARNAVYADETRFWADVTAKSPGNSRAWSNLGYVHALAGRSAAAEQAFLRALESDPGNARAAANLRLLREGRPVGAGEAPAPTGRR